MLLTVHVTSHLGQLNPPSFRSR